VKLWIVFILIGCSKSDKKPICNIEKIDHPQSEKITINRVIRFGEKKENLIKHFGQPDSAYIYYAEMSDIYEDVLRYKNSEFYFDENKLIGFDLHDTLFFLQIDDVKIKIGDVENCGKDSVYRKKIQNSDEYLMFIIKNNKMSQIHTWF
jgi:hypothetical protein